jgi:hypothetical protein
MERPKSVREAWRSFEAEAVPDANPLEKRLLRAAFYAGASTMVAMVLGLVDRRGGAEGLRRLMDECEAFCARHGEDVP